VKRQNLAACFYLFLILLPEHRAFAEETSPSPKAVRLFNGVDLSGWQHWLVDTRRADPRRVFTVTNGLLRISGDGLGYLRTERAYENYRLIVEFKWGKTNSAWGDRIGQARDSGIFLHSIGPDGNSEDGQGAFRAAIECNLFEGATGDLLLIRGRGAEGKLLAPHFTAAVADESDPDGWFYWKAVGRSKYFERWGRLNWFDKDRRWKDQFGFRGVRDVEKNAGEWNRVECICIGDRIEIVVNGTTVNAAREVWPREGNILLQCEGSEIFFRRVELQILEGFPRKPQ